MSEYALMSESADEQNIAAPDLEELEKSCDCSDESPVQEELESQDSQDSQDFYKTEDSEDLVDGAYEGGFEFPLKKLGWGLIVIGTLVIVAFLTLTLLEQNGLMTWNDAESSMSVGGWGNILGFVLGGLAVGGGVFALVKARSNKIKQD